ncbi:CAAX prenyl protease 2 isoform X3 [Amborella trichopoda]|uniref:CAAX prenyl protease 2 isoform X3 n=1 Tax=Amborella trichopoda TaxID=13333 RepID=UPI0009BC933C|nr:CAAX prenyl protease 2 isoform X3 [Amborella trichopoda]|eukprot:XP_020523022.1 CAAX prenyl protease 2 isoform X3 [Amborella trichopoda]
MEDSLPLNPDTMDQGSISSGIAVVACMAMALSYVLVLYAPTFILRLPPPLSLETYMIRRFACASISTAASLVACVFLLPMKRSWNASSIFRVYGIRHDHLQEESNGEGDSLTSGFSHGFLERISSLTSNVLAWRNYVVAPLTEELVFRACMIPLLLCGGFSKYTIVFLSPIFFSLAHVNHLLELYYDQRISFSRAVMSVGLQLGYTVIFGYYASFLFIRTGHLAAPIAAHVFCNVMGLPLISSTRGKGKEHNRINGGMHVSKISSFGAKSNSNSISISRKLTFWSRLLVSNCSIDTPYTC